jgi:phage terminase large subunit-like protein
MTDAWSFAVSDWRDRLASGASLVPALPLNQALADAAVNGFNRLRLPDVPDQPTFGQAAGDWFRDIVAAIFGSFDPESGTRKVNNVFLLVPKKNSKTTNGAGLMLIALILNQRPAAQFGLFGPTQEVADLAFQAVVGMIRADEDLSKLLYVQDHVKTITNRNTHAKLKVTTFDPSVATGGKFAGWLLDEAHLLSKTAYASRVVFQLRGARVAIPEAFGVIITTQSDLPPAGFFKEELQYARSVRDGKIDARGYLPVLYEFDEQTQTDRREPWADPALWHMVLPNLGRSVNLQVLLDDYATACAKGLQAKQIWASQHLNIEIGLALHNDRWRGADYWERSADPTLTLDSLIDRSEVITIGIDGGGLDDLMGLAVMGRERGTGRWLLWCHAYVDKSILKLRPAIAASLEQFEREGDLTFVQIGGVWQEADDGEAETTDASPGDADTSYLDPLVAVVTRIYQLGLLPKEAAIGLDTAGVAVIEQALVNAKIPADCIVSVPQGYRLSGIIAGSAIRLKAGTLKHAGSPMMAWCVGNAKSELRGSAIYIEKATAGAAKIDPLIAAFDAGELMTRNPIAGGTIYSANRGLRVFG